MFGKCTSSVVFFVIIAAVVAVVAAQVGYCYLNHKRKQNDQMWMVNVEELHFSEPVEVIGQGSFGVVLLAEYKGTKVAIKRVIAPGDKRKAGSKGGTADKRSSTVDSNDGSKDGSVEDPAKKLKTPSSEGSCDVESQERASGAIDSLSGSRSANNSILKAIGSRSLSTSGSGDSELDFLGGINFGRKKTRFQKMFPWLFPDDDGLLKTNILGTASGGGGSTAMSKSIIVYWCPWMDKANKQKQDFICKFPQNQELLCTNTADLLTVFFFSFYHLFR